MEEERDLELADVGGDEDLTLITMNPTKKLLLKLSLCLLSFSLSISLVMNLSGSGKMRLGRRQAV